MPIIFCCTCIVQKYGPSIKWSKTRQPIPLKMPMHHTHMGYITVQITVTLLDHCCGGMQGESGEVTFGHQKHANTPSTL